MNNIKTALRRRILDIRLRLSASEVDAKSNRILDRIRSLEVWPRLQEILLYMPVKNEVDPRPLLTELWQRKVRTLFPRCSPCSSGHLEWAQAACFEEFKTGIFSIPEPDPQTCAPMRYFSPDLVLIPGVAFDWDGYRLGYGGGYYDRFLPDGQLQGALLIGLAFEFQLLPELPRENWDQPVHAVITEKDILWINP